jgi:hypothetical protein
VVVVLGAENLYEANEDEDRIGKKYPRIKRTEKVDEENSTKSVALDRQTS